MSTEAQLPAATGELTAYVLRYCSLVHFCYFMLQQRRIPRKMWTLMLPSIERTLRSRLFVPRMDGSVLNFNLSQISSL
jgi:hypothetical protein